MRNILSVLFAVSLVACVAPQSPDEVTSDETSELAADPGTATPSAAEPAFTLSFLNSCSGNNITTNGGNAVIAASSSSCRRRDGSSTGPVSWGGFCTGDIANCNGNISCGC